MIVYPVIVEPHTDDLGDSFIARFPDIPSLTDCIGFEPEDAYLNAAERLEWALMDLFLAGERQPLASAIGEGQLGISTRLFWIVG